jgi:hypothetical protein
MKTIIAVLLLFSISLLASKQTLAEDQSRSVDPFTEISLRIGAKLYLEQGEKQNLEIVAKSSTLDEIITEVKDGKLIIRFPNKNFFWSDFLPGDITIYVTTPEINGLGISGSGDIIAEDEIKSKIIELAVSGSGNIKLSELSAERVKTIISGSGDITLNGNEHAQDLSVNISGSGNFKGSNYKADDVTVKIAGSGNADVEAENNLYIRLAGSGNVTYRGNPAIDQSIAGSGEVKNIK